MKTPDNQRIKLLISWLVTQGYATNQEDLGCKLGVISKSYLSQLVNGKANNEEFINKLSGVDSRINANWVRTGEGEMLKSGSVSAGSLQLATPKDKVSALKDLIADIQSNGKHSDRIHLIPMLNIDAVGGSSNYVCDTSEYIEELIPVKGAREDSVCISVSGDSMMPMFNPGDLVVIYEVVEWALFIEMGQYYVIALKDGRRLIKKVTYSEEDRKQQFLLVSENPKYPPVELPKSLIQCVFIVTQKHQKLTL